MNLKTAVAQGEFSKDPGDKVQASESLRQFVKKELSVRFPENNPSPCALSRSDGARELVAVRNSRQWKAICWQRIPTSFQRSEAHPNHSPVSQVICPPLRETFLIQTLENLHEVQLPFQG